MTCAPLFFHSSILIIHLKVVSLPSETSGHDIMTKEEKVQYWLDIADYDLDTAEAMYQTGRWLYVAFMCHQVIEKTLKAYWCGTQPDDPPYTHNHKRLADGCGLYEKMSDSHHRLLNRITNYNIEARYPEDKEGLSRMLTKDFCRQIINETKQLRKWIKDELSAAMRH